jgi:hypothetical protein
MSTGPQPPQPPYDPQRPPGPPQGFGPPQGLGPPPQGLGPPPQGFGPVPPRGYQPPMRADEEKLWAIGAHLGGLVLGFLAPLIVWLVFKDRSAFLDRTGKEALNMQLSYLLYFFAAGLTVLVLIGLFLLPLVGLAWLVLMIVATVKAANFEEYRYPVIIRFIS